MENSQNVIYQWRTMEKEIKVDKAKGITEDWAKQLLNKGIGGEKCIENPESSVKDVLFSWFWFRLELHVYLSIYIYIDIIKN